MSELSGSALAFLADALCSSGKQAGVSLCGVDEDAGKHAGGQQRAAFGGGGHDAIGGELPQTYRLLYHFGHLHRHQIVQIQLNHIGLAWGLPCGVPSSSASPQ